MKPSDLTQIKLNNLRDLAARAIDEHVRRSAARKLRELESEISGTVYRVDKVEASRMVPAGGGRMTTAKARRNVPRLGHAS
jgi:hypothetical protein